ncbi:MAG: DUF2235 domain-containing protein [Pseudomonadota bacterium]
MKRIAIFCDGTWNRSDARFPTNVVQLSQATLLRDPVDGTVQQVFYVPGVGTGRGATRLARWHDRILGGAMGLGLNLNLEEAYRSLVFAYEPGDEIYLFGFSRGAFTARSLAGFIRSAGIPDRSQVSRIPEALARYRSLAYDTHPDHEDSLAFRQSYAPRLFTSPVEADWRFLNGHPPGQPLKIAYLGVWDTVGALGVPGMFQILSWIFNGPHQFHDQSLSRSVEAARHAVAIDERRSTFEPTLWNNLDALNAAGEGDARVFRQEWFPGTHGSVGGGGDIRGLSDAAALWVARGAAGRGLAFDTGVLGAFERETDPRAPLHNQTAPPGAVERLLGRFSRDREGPVDVEDVAAITRKRWAIDRSYRPRTLREVADALPETS